MILFELDGTSYAKMVAMGSKNLLSDIERVNAFSEAGKNLKAEHQLSIANNLKNKIINKETEKCKK